MNYLGPKYRYFIPKKRGKIDFDTQKHGKDRIISCFLSVYSLVTEGNRGKWTLLYPKTRER